MFVWPDMYRLFNGGLDDFRAILRVTDDGVVIHREFLTANFGFKDFRAFLDFVTKADALVFAKELKHGEQLAIGVRIALDGLINAGTEHLLQVRAGHPAGR